MNIAELLKKKPRRFLSIDFGQAYVKILHLESIAGGTRLLNHDIKKVEFTDDKRPEIVNFIKKYLDKNSILEKDTHLSISNPDLLTIKHLTLPHLPKQEILSAAKWQLKDTLPDELEKYILDWQIVKEFVDEEGAKRDLLAFALAHKENLNKYVSILSECDITPISVSTGPFNYANILQFSAEKISLCAVLDIGYKDSAICVYKNNKLQFVRGLPYSTDRLITDLRISNRNSISMANLMPVYMNVGDVGSYESYITAEEGLF